MRPIILCGLGRMGWRVLAHLQTSGLPVVVIDNKCATTDPRLNHRCAVVGGVLADRCAGVLTRFFAAKRALGKK